MPILLFRVDERLIHGQVVVGWGSHLRPQIYLVVDEELPSSDWEQELYLLGVPPDARALFLTVEEAREAIHEWDDSPERAILLTRDVATMLDLARDARMSGKSVNLGGIHLQEGRKQVLPYIFLDSADRERLRALSDEGVSVTARDLPGRPEIPLEDLFK